MKQAFTLIEMLIVLSIITIIFLLTIPNIGQKQTIIKNKACDALKEVVNSQALLYEIETGETPDSVDTLINDGYLKESQRRCPDGTDVEITR